MTTRWITLRREDAARMGADRAGIELARRAEAIADGWPYTLGATFRDGRNWGRRELHWPVYFDGDGHTPAPFQASPFAIWSDHPTSPDVMMSQGMAALAAGDWERGWRLYEWRTTARHFVANWYRPYAQPVWNGKPLAGRTLLVHAEQGAGDTIQFARYLSALDGVGGEVVFLVSDEMLGLFGSLKCRARVVSHCDRFDYHIPLMSLPAALARWKPETARAYLIADPDLCEMWRQRLSKHGERPRVGLCWQGGREHEGDAQRSATIRQLMPHIDPGASLHALQVNAMDFMSADVRANNIAEWPSMLLDWTHTAAMISCLDLVVSVDTAVAHLAGALGIPCKLIIPNAPEWRWAAGERWYENHKIIKLDPAVTGKCNTMAFATNTTI